MIEILQDEVTAWSADINNTQRGVDWQMRIEDARCKLTSSTLRLNFDAALGQDFRISDLKAGIYGLAAWMAKIQQQVAIAS